jgi:hypothetical protein
LQTWRGRKSEYRYGKIEQDRGYNQYVLKASEMRLDGILSSKKCMYAAYFVCDVVIRAEKRGENELMKATNSESCCKQS